MPYQQVPSQKSIIHIYLFIYFYRNYIHVIYIVHDDVGEDTDCKNIDNVTDVLFDHHRVLMPHVSMWFR